jgi:hypothetical protein
LLHAACQTVLHEAPFPDIAVRCCAWLQLDRHSFDVHPGVSNPYTLPLKSLHPPAQSHTQNKQYQFVVPLAQILRI